MNKKKIHIITIANKLDQYQAMKASFIEAGFDEDRCRYSLFDNSQGNIYDPYRTFNEIKSQTQEPYIIFCHQDVLMNQGHGFEQLVRVLDELEKLDPQWAIAEGGIRETVKEEINGFLINDDNPIALGQAILKLIDNPDLAQAMSQQARQYVLNNWTWEKAIDRLEKYLIDYLDNKNPQQLITLKR